MTIEIHQDRAIFEISGVDRKTFIQGLITNDIYRLDGSNLIYSAMLNAKGRFIADLFIFEKNDTLICDIAKELCDHIIQKLNLYKLRANIIIEKRDDLFVGYRKDKDDNPHTFIDPRHHALGYRSYSNDMPHNTGNNNYDWLRIQHKIPEGIKDLTPEKSLILEFDFDNLNAIDYKKGCYIGQELTTRTHYRGEIRKKLIHLKITQTISDPNKVKKNTEITCEGKVVGIILSSIVLESEIHALALLKTSENLPNTNLMCDDIKIIIVD